MMAIKPVRELSFEIIREGWWKIKLEDGSELKIKPVLIRCFETDMRDPISGGAVHGFECQNALGVTSPEKLRGEPSSILPSPPEALKLDKSSIEVIGMEEPSGELHKGWNCYELENGEKVRVKLVVTDVYRIRGYYDALGEPYYVVRSATVWGCNSVYSGALKFSEADLNPSLMWDIMPRGLPQDLPVRPLYSQISYSKSVGQAQYFQILFGKEQELVSKIEEHMDMLGSKSLFEFLRIYTGLSSKEEGLLEEGLEEFAKSKGGESLDGETRRFLMSEMLYIGLKLKQEYLAKWTQWKQ